MHGYRVSLFHLAYYTTIIMSYVMCAVDISTVTHFMHFTFNVKV